MLLKYVGAESLTAGARVHPAMSSAMRHAGKRSTSHLVRLL